MAAKKTATKKAKTKKEPVEPQVDPTILGQACEWEGVEGTLSSVATYSEKTGLPDRVVFRPRQNPRSLVDVSYGDVVFSEDGRF